jgi:hypothetical protein
VPSDYDAMQRHILTILDDINPNQDLQPDQLVGPLVERLHAAGIGYQRDNMLLVLRDHGPHRWDSSNASCAERIVHNISKGEGRDPW